MLDRFNRPTLRSALALALMLYATVSRPVHGAGPPRELEPILMEADEHASAGRHDAALRAYAEAFEAMPAEVRVSGVGEFVVLAVGHAAVADYEQRGERESLEVGRRVILDFIASVEAAGPDGQAVPIDAAKQRLSEIERLMPKEVSSVEVMGADAEDEPEPELQPDPGDPTPDTNPGTLRGMGGAGVALLVVGGLGTIAGASLVILKPMPVEDEPLLATKVRSTRPLGGALLGGGVAVVVVGAVLLGLDRKQAKSEAQTKASAMLYPWLGSGAGGLGLHGRF